MTGPSPMKPPRMPILAGIAYFALVFALGFLLGTVRTIFVQDAPSAIRLLCRYIISRFAVAPRVVARAVMGSLAFALLFLAELLVGALLFGRTPSEHFALYRDASYALGLAAQIAFALMPLVQLWQWKKS
jgi:hypothetical protein